MAFELSRSKYSISKDQDPPPLGSTGHSPNGSDVVPRVRSKQKYNVIDSRKRGGEYRFNIFVHE